MKKMKNDTWGRESMIHGEDEGWHMGKMKDDKEEMKDDIWGIRRMTHEED